MRGTRQLPQRQAQLTGKAEASGCGLRAAAPLGHAGFDPDSVNTQDARGAIACKVDAGDQCIAHQYRHGVVAMHALCLWYKGFEAIVKVEQRFQPGSVSHQWIERREKSWCCIWVNSRSGGLPIALRETRHVATSFAFK